MAHAACADRAEGLTGPRSSAFITHPISEA